MSGEIEVGLEVGPGRSEGSTMITGRIRNLGDAVVDPQVFASELLVDGQPWLNWRLAIGNGTIDERLVALPPGDEVEFSREVDLSSAGPGSHRLVLRVLDAKSPPATT